MAERIEYRLRVARMLDAAAGYGEAISEAIALVREARRAIVRGSLGYRLFVARCCAAGGRAQYQAGLSGAAAGAVDDAQGRQ
jgi:hypothetical protein